MKPCQYSYYVFTLFVQIIYSTAQFNWKNFRILKKYSKEYFLYSNSKFYLKDFWLSFELTQIIVKPVKFCLGLVDFARDSNRFSNLCIAPRILKNMKVLQAPKL
jgi:hypothetical protein